MPLLLAVEVDSIPHLPPTVIRGIDDAAYTVALTYEEDKTRKSLLKISEKTGEVDEDGHDSVTW